MFYLLRRTWPSLLRTTLVCGTICYGLTLGFRYPANQAPAPESAPGFLRLHHEITEAGLRDLRERVAAQDQAFARLVELYPELAPILAAPPTRAVVIRTR